MRQYHIIYACIAFSLLACESGDDQQTGIQYPETRKDTTVVDEYYGTEVADPYRWLEDDLSDETAEWVKRQNAVTFNYLEQIPFRNELKKRLTELTNYEKYSAPSKEGEYYYYQKNDGLQNQPVVYRVKNLEDDPEVFINPNTFSEDGTTSLTGLSFSESSKYCAYSISEAGSDWRKVFIMNVEDKTLREDSLVDVKFSGLSWYKDHGLYYSSYDKPKEGSKLSAINSQHKLFYHELGTPQSEDQLIFGGEAQPRRYVFADVTEDHNYLVIMAANSTTGHELYIKDLSEPNSQLTTVLDNMETESYIRYCDEDTMYILTNLDAPNNKLVKVSANAPTPDNWENVIPEKDMVLDVGFAGESIFTQYLKDVHTVVDQYDLQGNLIRNVDLPGKGEANGFSGKKENKEVFYSYESFTQPNTIFRYDIASGTSEVFKQPKVNIDTNQFTTKQVFYESKDGTEIPMYIVHKKDLKIDGNNPTYLYGYGGFNISLKPGFSSNIMAWLEQGGVFAQPNLRGGGEYGEEWHLAGTKTKKQNVFDDFIAAAEYLIKENYTSSDYLTIAGRSNGGLLVGACMTQRPDLYKVALPAVGVLDMLRYHKFTAGAGWAYDYGTADESEEMFSYLLDYSPLHNIEEGGAYPATLITTADHDDRVVPAHSFKFAATLQEKHAGDAPVLIRIETKAGHGAGKPLSKRLEEKADEYAFAWYQMGIEPTFDKEEIQ